MGGPNKIGNNPIGKGYVPPALQGQGNGVQNARLKEFALTIDDFRKFASGAYNAGGANPNERARFAWARMESAKADPSEAAALRLSFAFALEAAGVSGGKMADICRRLGLEADFSFSEESAKVYTALSREEVRDIIDHGFAAPKKSKAQPPKNNVIPPKENKPKINGTGAKFNLIQDKDDDFGFGGFKKKNSINNIINDNNNIINDNIINDNIIINNDDEDIIIDNKSFIRNDSRKNSIIDDEDIKIDSYDEKKVKASANKNLRTLAVAMLDHYGEKYGFDDDEIESIIKQVPDWELELASCSTKGNGTSMLTLNEDLRNFLLNNQNYMQPLIDQAIEEKKKQ